VQSLTSNVKMVCANTTAELAFLLVKV